MTLSSLRRGFALPALLVIAACGGGGSNAAPAAPQAPVNRAPTAAFTAAPISGTSPLTVDFDASSSADADGSITRFTWNFGDGSPTATGAVISHRYTAGSDGARYDVRLTVEDDDGATGTRSAEIRVAPPRGRFTLSGTVQILPSSSIDSDVNDELTTPVANDDFDTAQPLPNPVTLGGYVSRPGAGENGNLRDRGDIADFFEVSLSGNETLLVTVGEPSAGTNLSLQLYRSDRVGLDSVPGITESGSITAPGPGTYYVEVAITEGATNYVLNLGQTVPTVSGTPRLSDAFVPGEIVLSAPDGVALPEGLELKRSGGGVRLLAMSPARLRERSALARIQGLHIGGRMSAADMDRYETLAAVAQLRRQADVIAEPNYIRRALLTPNDPYYRYQWHYPGINLPLAWDITTGSPNVIVAVIDTGILPNHPDLIGQLVDGYDFISSPTRALDGDGIDADPSDPGDLAFGGTSSFHGTHVAGTVAASSDDGVGVAGVAWNARIMPLRVLGRDGGTSYDVIQAMRFAARLSNDSGTLPPQRADVINLSLGSSGSSSTEQQQITAVRNAGVLVVASAGNDHSNSPFYPAAYQGVVSVAATTIDKRQAPYSNSGATIDVAAPGGYNGTDLNGDGLADGVVSTIGNDAGTGISYAYAALMGTSMAAPHISGVAALMHAVYPALSPDDFDTLLATGAITEDLGAGGRDNTFGNGLIDAQKAVIAALDLANANGAPTGPILTGSPGSLNFGFFDTGFDVVVRNAGSGSLRVTAFTASEPWLDILPIDIDANGLGSYRLAVNRALAPGTGTFAATARFDSDVPGGLPFTVAVVMQNLQTDPVADAGRHYVIAWHPFTGVTAAGVTVTASNGAYNFELDEVGPGTYQIYAGTDSDNDGFLCDGGEACGAFRTLDLPESITVSGDRSNLDFVSGFRTNLFDASAVGPEASTDPMTIPRSRELPPLPETTP